MRASLASSSSVTIGHRAIGSSSSARLAIRPLLRVEPSVLGVNLGEIECSRGQHACVFCCDKILGSIPVLHQLQRLNEFFWWKLKTEQRVSQEHHRLTSMITKHWMLIKHPANNIYRQHFMLLPPIHYMCK